MKRIGFIAATKRHLDFDDDVAIRDYYSVSPLFRYSLAYCEKTYDETIVLSVGAKHLLYPDNGIVGVDTQLQWIDKREKKKWLREVSNFIKETYPVGTELYFHTPSWYRPLFKWLEPYFAIHQPLTTPVKRMRDGKEVTELHGMSIGNQLKFYRDNVGQLPTIRNEEAK